ncbi:MAG: ribonuclease HII [bacterium]|nr:ribonuclease HII [bacterium]
MQKILQEERKLWRKGYKYVACLDEVGRGCERPDAEVLTNNGWKFYHEINLEDKVLSYTDNGFIKWQKIEKVIEKDFKGNLLELKNRGIKMVVTPDHYFTVLRRVSKRDKKDNNRLKLVGYKTREERKLVTDLSSNDFIPRGGKWKGINKKNFKLPKINKYEEKPIDIKLWVAFLGIFLSEGSTFYYKKKGSYGIVISQSETAPQDRYKKIYYLLKKLPFKFTEIKTGFRCLNKQLYTYLKQFGRCYNKFIPKEIKALPPYLLNILIFWMMLGDGGCYTGKNRKEVCVYYTVSEKLRDDFEEVLLKAGWTYHASVRALKDSYIRGRLIKKENKVPCFEIRLRRNNKVIVKHLHKKEIFYKGKVFCLQLAEHRNFFVRRNGTGYFTGNSLAGPVMASAVVVTTAKVKNQPPTKILWGTKIKNILKEINDSKKLSPTKREKLYKVITKFNLIEWQIGRVSEKVIDKINILEATKLAMVKAIKKLKRKPDFLIIDGNFKLNLPIHQKSIIKADEKVFSCMAAGIIAKVTRDRIMEKLHKEYPRYGFNQHKGYPTKYHIKMLKKHGPSKIHRKTFGPLKRFF